MQTLRIPSRPSILTSLALAGALALTGCGGHADSADSSPETSAASSASSASEESAAPETAEESAAPETAEESGDDATTGAESSGSAQSDAASSAASASDESSEPVAEGTSAATSAASSEPAAESSEPEATESAPVADGSAASTDEQCSGLSGPEAWAAAKEQGIAEDVDEEHLGAVASYDHYDDCAGLSAVVVNKSWHSFAPAEVVLFRHGQPVGTATDYDHPVPVIERVADESLQITYHFPKDGEAYAEASGRAVFTVTWDQTSGEVVRTGEVPPTGEIAGPSQTASPEPSSTPTEAEASADEDFGVLQHGEDKSFCFYGDESVSCFGKHNNMATLPVTGEPTLKDDLPATGWETLPNVTQVEVGDTETVGPFTCEATQGGFDCENTQSGATISVAGPEMSSTPPTR